MRLLLDTNVVVSALLWDGAPKRLLKDCHSKGILPYTSRPLLLELADALTRPKFAKKIAESLYSVDQLIELYSKLVIIVRPILVPRIAPDPDDDVVIGTALAAKADYVVTGDRTLLSVKEYEGVRMISVREILQTIDPGTIRRTSLGQ
jgi:uncharacterized protein